MSMRYRSVTPIMASECGLRRCRSAVIVIAVFHSPENGPILHAKGGNLLKVFPSVPIEGDEPVHCASPVCAAPALGSGQHMDEKTRNILG